MEKKTFAVSKTQAYEAIKNALAEVGVETISVEVGEETVEFNAKEFLDYQVALIKNKKSTPKAKVDNTENIEIVRKALADNPNVSATDLVALTGLPNTQKIVSVVKAMGDAVKTEKKGKKTTYSLV